MRTTPARRAAALALAVGTVLAACSPASDDAAAPMGSTAPPGDRPAAGSAAPDPPAAARVAPTDVPVRDADLASAAPSPAPAPVGVALPTLGVDVPVDPVGVQSDGQMEIPPLAERAGWYRFGPAPGEAEGTAVVAAHVDSVASAALGPFARLGELRPGDAVAVTLEDGRTVAYAVRDVGAQPKPDVVWADVFRRDGPPRLVLITCGGTFDEGARSYTDNVIVIADPVGA